ncbi:hypothetical protein HLB03_03140, partial [Acidianus sp. DSM 29099]|nr:hypothetical protein [Acidianus sp. RZ1]
SRRTIYNDELIEVIVPFLVAEREDSSIIVLSPQQYKGKVRSIFGLSRQEISTPISSFMSVFENVLMKERYPDNLKVNREVIAQGLRELSEDGWKTKRSLDEYYV